MFLFRLLILTVVFFIVFNFSQIRSGSYEFKAGSLVFPFSLSFALVLVDYFLRAAFIYAFILFVVIASLCYFLLCRMGKKGYK